MIRIVKYEPQWVQQAIKQGKKPFFVQMPIEHDHKQGVTTITGLGTAVERSRTGHKMMQKFVNKLKETSKDKPLFVNHDPNQIAGLVTGVKQSKADEIHPIAKLRTPNQNQIVDAPRANVESLIQDKIPIGMSFGGTADDVKIVQEADGSVTYEVNDGELMEWSITPINAVKRSDNSVQNADCPGGICQQIANQIRDGPYLPEITEEAAMALNQNSQTNVLKQSSGVSLNQNAIDNAIELITSGNVDFDTPWNRGTYEWDNDDVNELSTYCLGMDTTSSGSMDRYQYRIGMGGKIYKNAVISVADNAPAGSPIYQAADELLEQIYSMDDTGSSEEEDENSSTTQTFGGNNMVNEISNEELKQLVGTLAQSVKDQGEIIKNMKQAEDDRLAQEAKLAEEARVKAEHDQLITDVAEANAEMLGEILGPILKSRQGLGQASLQTPNMLNQGATANPVDMTNMTPEQIQQFVAQQSTQAEKPNFRDSVEYPAVWMGQAIKGGKTPAQMFGTEQTYV